MKGKLIKREDGYYLFTDESYINAIASDHKNWIEIHNGYKLSLKNCEEIDRGYDLDELSENHAEEIYVRNENDYNELANFENRKRNFEDGFQKALEIIGDKKFSELDMRIAYDAGCNNIDADDNIDFQDTINSLQQTEFDVEIEVERSKFITDKSLRNDIKNGFNYTQKLDAEGCLILKRL
jgi:hypothetical protein